MRFRTRDWAGAGAPASGKTVLRAPRCTAGRPRAIQTPKETPISGPAPGANAFPHARLGWGWRAREREDGSEGAPMHRGSPEGDSETEGDADLGARARSKCVSEREI